MTHVMAYIILVSAGIGACAAAIEAVVRGRKAGTRGIWIAGMGITIGTTLFAMVAPRVVDEVVVETAPVTLRVLTTSPARPLVSTVGDVPAGDRLLAAADFLLPLAWLAATLVLLIALALGRWRYRRERKVAQPITIAGHNVLLTEATGPAVAGVRQPVVFIPRWVLALDEGAQRLLLAHEAEHVKNRDTLLLLFGALTAALTPWNPVVWWMVRRLRVAVEQDCDARVLARYPHVRRYADLLLLAASRPGLTARLLAAHFGEHTSDLLRRIDAMTNRRMPVRTLVTSVVSAAALLAAACETLRPEPVAPLPAREAAPVTVTAQSTLRSKEFTQQVARCTAEGEAGCQVSVIVQSSNGNILGRYDDEIPVSHLPQGWVDKVDVEQASCGRISCSLVWITLKPGRLILKSKPIVDEIELKADTSWARAEAFVRPLKTPEFVELDKSEPHFHFDSKLPDEVEVPVTVVEQSANREARGQGMVQWPAWTRYEAPNIVILSNDRTELRRVLSADVHKNGVNAFDEILPADVAAFEYHGKRGCTPLDCPLVNVIIRPGREAAYKR